MVCAELLPATEGISHRAPGLKSGSVQSEIWRVVTALRRAVLIPCGSTIAPLAGAINAPRVI